MTTPARCQTRALSVAESIQRPQHLDRLPIRPASPLSAANRKRSLTSVVSIPLPIALALAACL